MLANPPMTREQPIPNNGALPIANNVGSCRTEPNPHRHPTPYLHRHPYVRSAARGLLTTHPYKTTGALPQPTRWRTALQAGRSRIPFPIMSVKVFIDNPSCRTGPGVDSVSNINQYQKYFLRGKGGRWVVLTTVPLSYANYLEIWEPQSPETLRVSPGL